MTAFLTNEALHQKSSEQITALLYEAALTNLEEALAHNEQKEYIDANEKLKKAGDIVYRLGAGLNYEAGIVADQLDQVYNYIADKIIEANYKKDNEIIREVIQIVESIMSAWNEAMKVKKDPQSSLVKQKAQAYESTSMYES
ncbi:flagellar export chaperone FliS [Halalkalibacter sp. APA_J-10(15)]|uniref:flagellar export chaperone FliS n=1 Tax=unclassified Halalkalibacter TaxID=2893063 RepID=UPI001FF2482C|nr:flagellar protein FliS [Halalkalibacter sp. APA_J-10(15)]MCK0471470.1 flagellar protein FliS [Halalkalibacter sp. APA_J-10(15)]